jgi:hypothetical protein
MFQELEIIVFRLVTFADRKVLRAIKGLRGQVEVNKARKVIRAIKAPRGLRVIRVRKAHKEMLVLKALRGLRAVRVKLD